MTWHMWLDDERLPAALPSYKGAQYVDVTWDWVKSVPQAIARIERFGIENAGFMALDHDLGMCPDCQAKIEPWLEQIATLERLREVNELMKPLLIREPDKASYSSCIHNGDGTRFVEWMRDTNTWPAIRPTVHSFNPDGARRMRQIIADHYDALEPFSAKAAK